MRQDQVVKVIPWKPYINGNLNLEKHGTINETIESEKCNNLYGFPLETDKNLESNGAEIINIDKVKRSCLPNCHLIPELEKTTKKKQRKYIP